MGPHVRQLAAMPQPVVAAIDGQAWGGGCELRWRARCGSRATAHFGQPEVAVGIIPGGGGTQRLPRLVGAGRAAELILSARIIDAAEALRIGLVEAVLPTDGFVAHVLEWVRADGDQTARRAVRRQARDRSTGCSCPLDEGLRVEGRLFIECQIRPETIAIQEPGRRRRARADARRLSQIVELEYVRRRRLREGDEVEEVVGPVVDDAVGHQQHAVRARAR